MATYSPLAEHLRNYAGSEVRLTFDEIEAIIGAPLPPSALKHEAWWANSRTLDSHTWAHEWQAAGWERKQYSLAERWVIFSHRGLIAALPTPQANDIADGPPDRVATTTYRILRDTELARRVKDIHRFECQICSHTIQLPDGSRYAEAHHIQPLGRPHDGPDTIGNILCLCPNHHAELDYGVAAISLSTLSHFDGHAIDSRYVEYHNRQIHKAGNAS